MNNLTLRLISGIVFVAVIVGAILFSPFSVVAVFTPIVFLAVREFHLLTNKNSDIEVSIPTAVAGGVLLFINAFLMASGNVNFPVYVIYGLYIVGVFLWELFRKKQNPINNWAHFLLGQIYVALPFSLLNYILYFNNYQPFILLAVFISIWVNDTGAYCTGMLLGRHKLFERVSPKKTWEGFIGGAAFVLVSGYIFSRYIPELTLWQWFIFSEIIVVFGTLGDLSESLLKRTLGVKDSGNLLPGHGGALDRFDSMMMAAPVIFLFLKIIVS